METALALRSRLVAVGQLLAAGVAGTLVPPAASAGDKRGLHLPRIGFTCCNLRYEGDWISDGNYAVLPSIPAGTPITVVSLGRDTAYVEIGGKKIRLGDDYGRKEESLEQWISKIVVEEDPAPWIASYPAEVQAAIKECRVMLGMTREQTIVAIGYPLTSETPSLDAPIWRHWVSSFEEYQLSLGAGRPARRGRRRGADPELGAPQAGELGSATALLHLVHSC